MGTRNSSLTRVQPLFNQLLDRDESGQSWLPALLAAGDRSGAVLDEALRTAPGTLLPAVVARDENGRRACFEHRVQPPEELLRWLIEHAPEFGRPIAPDEFDDETVRLREKLFAGDGETKELALRLLEEHGAPRSGRKWWAFEGATSVDCWLETEKLILFIEGKRTEPLSGQTTWMPRRNQLIRNLDVIKHEADGKAAFVLLAVEEEPISELAADDYAAGAPQLGANAKEILEARYLGQATWKEICEASGVDRASLPEELPG